MICKGCREAALAAFEDGLDRAAEWMHALCVGGTWCDCQHDISQTALNPAFVSTSSHG